MSATSTQQTATRRVRRQRRERRHEKGRYLVCRICHVSARRLRLAVGDRSTSPDIAIVRMMRRLAVTFCLD